MTDDDFILGGGVSIDGTFTNADGDPADPTNLTLAVKRPDGSTDTVDPGTFVHVATGHYRAAYTPAVAGLHEYLWLGSGALPVAVDGEFFVREPVTEAPLGWQAPTGGLVWDQSSIDFSARGYTTGTLQAVVEEAAAWVSWATGRNIDGTLPVNMQPLARKAVRMRTEQDVMRTTGDAIQAATQEGIASVSVSGLSVSFRDPRSSAGLGSARGAAGSPFPTSWDALNEVLLALMTDDRLEWWRFQVMGQQPPAFAVGEQAFRFQGDFELPDYDGFGRRSGEWPGFGIL